MHKKLVVQLVKNIHGKTRLEVNSDLDTRGFLIVIAGGKNYKPNEKTHKQKTFC